MMPADSRKAHHANSFALPLLTTLCQQCLMIAAHQLS